MDTTALSLCMDNRLQIHVFGLDDAANIERVARGEKIGTVITSDGKGR
jgi:uridylate kinase